MLISDLVLKARRILGDVEAQRWSDARMLDIINDGLKDINTFANVYRGDHFFELVKYQTRYPLPRDLVAINSVWYNNEPVELLSRYDVSDILYVTKHQLNVGVIEVVNQPDIAARDKRFVAGPTDITGTDVLTTSIWSDDTWTGTGIWSSTTLWGIESGHVVEVPINPLLGVVSNPVETVFGVTEDLTVSIDIYAANPTTPFGMLTAIFPKTQDSIPLKTGGDVFGVLTGIQISTEKAVEQSGAIGTVNKPFRIVGRYGTVTSVLNPSEYLRILYKALPPYIETLGTAFPLSASWEKAMVNWIVGSALQDDNDANNNARAIAFLTRYTRDLDEGKVVANLDYGLASKKYITKYRGGITQNG